MTTPEPAVSVVVVDSSVSLKWVLPDEDHIAGARRLRRAVVRQQLARHVPLVWQHEIVNGLLVAARRHRLSAERTHTALDYMVRVPVTVHAIDPQLLYRTAMRYGVGGFDAAYLAVAEALRAPLWTGDRRLFNTVSAAAPCVCWLGGFPAAPAAGPDGPQPA